MNIPRYWAKGTSDKPEPVTHPHSGATIHDLSCWGWSASSEEEARACGVELANALHARFERGDVPTNYYGYPDRPMREEILDEWTDDSESLFAVVTRNGYGCQVLNTATIMFIDVDLPPPKAMTLTQIIGRIFGGKRPETADDIEKAALDKVRRMVKRDPELSLRAYRTAAGLRYLVTHAHRSPTTEESHAMMEALGADPLYMRLCKVQQCFRARLTPKPWRCDHKALPYRFPYTDDHTNKAVRDWVESYTQASTPYATCEFVHHYGSKHMDEEIQRVVSTHDDMTGAHSGRPLA